MMDAAPQHLHTARYAKCIEVSKRVRWDIERDVIRGRGLDFAKPFLPEGLARLGRVAFLTADERRFASQIQGRTYAAMFGMVERYIGPKLIEVTRDHWFGDQVAFEALVRFTDEELKHQELFRRLERMAAAGMPEGYSFRPDANEVAKLILSKSTWAVLAFTCLIELFTQDHYRASIEPDASLCELWKDVFLFHWKEESQHAILDELEWMRENGKLEAAQRDAAVDDLIALVGAVDVTLQAQARADAAYFVSRTKNPNLDDIQAAFLAAYRWQYIVSGAQHKRFNQVLGGMVTPAQGARIAGALRPIVDACHAH
jgi:hypothetical protein